MFTEQNVKVYRCRGIKINPQEAIQKINQINQINNSNNQLLSTIKIGLGYFQPILPNKLSQDLHDIYQTCNMYFYHLSSESDLIQSIKSLIQQLNQLNYKWKKQIDQKQAQIQRQMKINSEKEKSIKQLNSKIIRLHDEQSSNIKLISENFCLKKDFELLKAKIPHMEKQINRQKLTIQNFNINKFSEVRKVDWNKTIKKLDNSQLCPILNNEHQKEMLKINQMQKMIESQRQSKRQLKLEEENFKLREWIKTFVESIDRILQIRMKKLRESAASEQEIYKIYKYLPQMHLKTITQFYDHTEFPYASILYDFELIMRQAEQLQYENEKYRQMDFTAIKNKNLAKMVITELRNIKAQILEEFKNCGYQRQRLAIQYESLIKYDENILESVNQLTLDELRKFQYHPKKLLKQIQNETQDLRKYREYLTQNFSQDQPYLITKIIKLNKDFQKYLNESKDEVKRKELNKREITFQEQVMKRQVQSQKDVQIERQEQRRKREYEQQYREAKQYIMKSMTEKSFKEQISELQDQLTKRKTAKEVKDYYMSLFGREPSQIGKDEGANGLVSRYNNKPEEVRQQQI